jgi:hypothetical protein
MLSHVVMRVVQVFPSSVMLCLACVFVKESLNFELWLQRCGENNFMDLFVISGKWLGVFLEIFLKI